MKKIFENPEKEWWKSKTIWVNVLAIIGGVLTALSGEINAGSTITVLSFANLILRVISKHKITK